MAVLPFRPTPFFANKNRAFWNLQLAGWGSVFLLRATNALANDRPVDLLVILLVTTITGFSISLVLSVIYRQLINKKPVVMWGLTLLSFLGAFILHVSIDSWVQGLYYPVSADTSFVQRFIRLSYTPLTLLGGWSALYYAINYFLTVEEQADRLERLQAQATSAHLAMLRYQLNPHFLFNTLNSISTLVLLKQTAPANAMLTRLSAFLRHTLITEPGGQVTLAQEIETLQLYLDIERMRFEERLRTHFAVEDEALKARLPSMLLQPLIENAIKYAVSPQEEGARISLEARVQNGRLQIGVEDTGPGLTGPEQGALLERGGTTAEGTPSTGVGLANIRSRLAQAYGEKHRFETTSNPSGGFSVYIEIPFETAEETETSEDQASIEGASAPQAIAHTQTSPAPSPSQTPALAGQSSLPLEPNT